MAEANKAYLTVPEAAEVLGVTANNVYKLLKAGKIPSVRLSERGTRISRGALDAYQRRLNGDGPVQMKEVIIDEDALRSAFQAETGLMPEAWIAAWKDDDITDTAENNRLAARALALRDDGSGRGAAVATETWAAGVFQTSPQHAP